MRPCLLCADARHAGPRFGGLPLRATWRRASPGSERMACCTSITARDAQNRRYRHRSTRRCAGYDPRGASSDPASRRWRARPLGAPAGHPGRTGQPTIPHACSYVLGFARIDPGARPALCDPGLMAIESEARRYRRGLWRESRQPPDRCPRRPSPARPYRGIRPGGGARRERGRTRAHHLHRLHETLAGAALTVTVPNAFVAGNHGANACPRKASTPMI